MLFLAKLDFKFCYCLREHDGIKLLSCQLVIIQALSLELFERTWWENVIKVSDSDSSTVVEHSPHNPKVKCSNPDTVVGTRIEKTAGKSIWLSASGIN